MFLAAMIWIKMLARQRRRQYLPGDAGLRGASTAVFGCTTQVRGHAAAVGLPTVSERAALFYGRMRRRAIPQNPVAVYQSSRTKAKNPRRAIPEGLDEGGPNTEADHRGFARA